MGVILQYTAMIYEINFCGQGGISKINFLGERERNSALTMASYAMGCVHKPPEPEVYDNE